MAKPSTISPLGYLIDRQYTGSAGVQNRFLKERLAKARNLYRKDLLAHYGCVNAIEFSEEGEILISGGDDRRILLWSIPEALYGNGSPVAMQTSHNSNIFCLAFDSTNSKIFSGGNDDQVIIHDTRTGHLLLKLVHRRPVYGLSLNPQNDCVLATAGDDGRVLIFDLRESSGADPLCLTRQKNGVYSVKFNPMNPRWLVTANSEEGITLWDTRKPKEQLLHYDANAGQVSGVSACFNSSGSHLLALRRRLPPVLYATQKEDAVCQFYHPQYYNSCTMKTCSFAGENDEYILSGSDDFNLYMWQIPEDDSEWGQSHMILHGHRSIVNQVRYNKRNNFIASSGVEKMIKLWSTVPVGTWDGSLSNGLNDSPRGVYSHDDYVYLVGHGGRISHDYSDQSTQEDSKMMAFFDSLIQREIEFWKSDDTVTSTSDSDTHENAPLEKLPKKPDESARKKPNRIAQLIAQKRNRLAKMAQGKASSSIKRYTVKEKLRKRKLALKSKSSKYSKSNGLTHKKSAPGGKHGSSSADCTADRRQKHEPPEKGRLRKYRTRQSLRDICDSSTSNNSLDGPSTSTGITGSSTSVFRIVVQDSDEDVPPSNCTESRSASEENLVNILPTPLNGTHDMYVNVLEMASGSGGNVVTVRNEDYAHASTSNGFGYENAASTSENGRLNNNCGGEDYENCSVSYKLLNEACKHIDDYIGEDTFADNNTTYLSESDSDYEFDCRTPSPCKKRRASASITDSGCGSGPCSSNGTLRNHPVCSNNGSFHDHSSEEGYDCVRFKKRVKKAKLNIRKHIGADSDSN